MWINISVSFLFTASPVAIPVTWPEGTYSLAKPTAGCPAGDFTWYEGWRLQDTETQSPDNAWSTGNHFAGNTRVLLTNAYLFVCKFIVST